MTPIMQNYQSALEYCKSKGTSLPEGRQKNELVRLAKHLTNYNKSSTWLNIIKLNETEGAYNIYYGN